VGGAASRRERNFYQAGGKQGFKPQCLSLFYGWSLNDQKKGMIRGRRERREESRLSFSSSQRIELLKAPLPRREGGERGLITPKRFIA